MAATSNIFSVTKPKTIAKTLHFTRGHTTSSLVWRRITLFPTHQRPHTTHYNVRHVVAWKRTCRQLVLVLQTLPTWFFSLSMITYTQNSWVPNLGRLSLRHTQRERRKQKMLPFYSSFQVASSDHFEQTAERPSLNHKRFECFFLLYNWFPRLYADFWWMWFSSKQLC